MDVIASSGSANPPRGASVWTGAAAGLVAAGAALGTGQLLSGLSARIPSLVVAVGDVFVDNTPGSVVRTSIDTLGTNQKPALVWGITLVALALGAAFGALARRRPTVGLAGFAAFGVLGGWAAARYPGSSAVLGWISGLVAAAVGGALLWALLGRPARSPTGAGTPPSTDRRRFLVLAGAGAFLGLFGAGLGRRLRDRFGVERAREEVAAQLGASARTAPPAVDTATVATFDEVPGVSPLITPNTDFYRIDTALSVPQVDPDSWRLRITGLVEREVEITFDELVAMEMVTHDVTLACVSNEVGGQLVGNARWQGVPLAGLLERAGPAPECTQLVGRSVDGWTAGFPTELAFDGRPALVAVAMNGEPLPVDHGFPARLIVAGLYGYVSATKWLSQIECTTWEAYDAYWIPRGWAKEGPIKTQSRIDTPRRNATLTPGPTALAGVAWAPDRGVERVEVQIDDGPWQDAQLSGELSIDSWRQWLLEWDADPGDHRIRVRATDGTGDTQTEERTPVAPDGATGWHTIEVTVRA